MILKGSTYSPMAEPTTLRLVLADFSACMLNIDDREINPTFLNREFPKNEQLFAPLHLDSKC